VFKPILVSCSVLVLTLSVLTAPISANAQDSKDLKINQKSQKDTSKILDNLKQKDPQKLESQKLERNRNDQNELNSDQKDLKVKFDLKNKKVKLSSTDKGETSINIPNKNELDSVDIVDNKVVYSGKNSKIDVVVESIDGGVRQVINIKDSSAPSFYDFPVELGKDDKLELTENGGAIITTKNPKPLDFSIKDLPKDLDQKTIDQIKSNRSIKTSIAKPWAKDNNGKDLKTWYTIEKGNILRQNIDLKGAVFPVVADPAWCGNAVNYVTWINRDGLWSASINTTSCGAWHCAATWGCWQEAYDKTPLCARWSGWTCVSIPWNKQWNTSQYWSMYNQFTCHANWAGPFKLGWVWNIEPAKADKGNFGFVRSLCN
jgi:hypothetical protein